MSPTRISIDLCDSPLRVGGQVMGKYMVAAGSKGRKLTGGGTSTTSEEVVACLEDAHNVLRGFINASSFDAAVVVVPNTTSDQNKNNIFSHGRHSGFNITQVIQEQVAVSAAYIQKVEPSEKTTLVIISLTGGIPEVSVITILPLDIKKVDYHLTLEAHKFHNEHIDFDESKHEPESVDYGVGGFVSSLEGAAEALVENPPEKASNILNDILRGLELKLDSKVEKMVLVGKASEKMRQAAKQSFPDIKMWRGDEELEEIVAYDTALNSYFHWEKVREAANESFPDAVVWDGDEKPEEIAAYGAAFLSDIDKRLRLHQPGESITIPYGSTYWRKGVVSTPIGLAGDWGSYDMK